MEKKKQWYVVSVKHRFENDGDKIVLAEFLNNGWKPFGATAHSNEGFYYHLRKKT